MTDTVLLILAGGMLGVVLGKFLDSAPGWVFWLLVLGLFIVTILLLQGEV